MMPEKWTGRLVGKMHIERVTGRELAKEMGVTARYVSMLLNGDRKPKGVQKRMEEALDAILRRRKQQK